MKDQEFEIMNAVIESATIDDGDRGLLTAWLQVEHPNGHQGFGGYALYLPKDFQHGKVSNGFAGHFIFRCMQIAGVSSWDKLIGRTIRVKCNHSKIQSIGHIIKDDWFTPSEDFKD